MIKIVGLPLRDSLTKVDELHLSNPSRVEGWNVLHVSNKVCFTLNINATRFDLTIHTCTIIIISAETNSSFHYLNNYLVSKTNEYRLIYCPIPCVNMQQ